MSQPRSFLLVISVALLAGGCGGGQEPGMGPGTGGPRMPGAATGGTMGPMKMGAAGMSGKGPGAGPTMGPGPAMGNGAVVVIGIPTSSTTGSSFPGGGPNGSAPLAAGCTPASAHECPTTTGVCATSATSKPTGTMSGSICFYGPTTSTTTTSGVLPAATIEYLHETAASQEYYRFRITFDPAFVDNTYGANAMGWGQRGHTFKDLVGSDHVEMSLFDADKTMVSMFDLDYITAAAAASCGYAALGVSGGEGKMLLGDSKHILSATTSLDRNLNGCGYCNSTACGGSCTTSSPATDARYTVNGAAAQWDYRVAYEVWVDAAAFAGNGFGGASIAFVHASPSKASSDTVTVTPKPCCPTGESLFETESGWSCKPGGSCPVNSVPVVAYQLGNGEFGTGDPTTPTPSTCTSVPTCPAGYVARSDVQGGTICRPVPTDGQCPSGYMYIDDEAGPRCL